MIEATIKMIEQAVADGLFMQLHSPSGTHDIDEIEAIEAVRDCEEADIRIDDMTIIFGNGDVCITIEDPDEHLADASNHVTGE
jgi:hypothetical protein